jgi:RNA polymerase sigma factor (TIGR02999 family)
MTRSDEVAEILAEARRGEEGAVERLTPLVYDELRRMAHNQLRRMRPGRTLNTTALVHEAYLKLAGNSGSDWRDRSHFIAVAVVAMRHLLVDYARARAAQKRGGEVLRVTFDEELLEGAPPAVDLLAVNQALDSLAERSQRLSRLVELRFFGGLTVAETAEVLETSERTIKRDWQKARAFLYRRLVSAEGGGTPSA